MVNVKNNMYKNFILDMGYYWGPYFKLFTFFFGEWISFSCFFFKEDFLLIFLSVLGVVIIYLSYRYT